MEEKTADIDILEEKIEKDYKDMMAVINSTSLPLFVEDTIEDMHILIENLIAENKELKETVEKRNNKIYELLDRSINALKLTNKEEVKQDYIPSIFKRIYRPRFDINFCPMCGRKLRRNNTDEH